MPTYPFTLTYNQWFNNIYSKVDEYLYGVITGYNNETLYILGIGNASNSDNIQITVNNGYVYSINANISLANSVGNIFAVPFKLNCSYTSGIYTLSIVSSSKNGYYLTGTPITSGDTSFTGMQLQFSVSTNSTEVTSDVCA